MTRDRAIGEDLTQAAGQGSPRKGEGNGARDAQDEGPDVPRLLQLMLRAQIADGNLGAAGETAARLARMPNQPEALDLLLDAAIGTGAVQTARTAIVEAEDEGAIAPWRAAYHKARIAFETGDLLAARAILLPALDAAPGNAALRALLAEAMVAAGTAAEARAVLGHIGSPPVNPAPGRTSDSKGQKTASATAPPGTDPPQG